MLLVPGWLLPIVIAFAVQARFQSLRGSAAFFVINVTVIWQPQPSALGSPVSALPAMHALSLIFVLEGLTALKHSSAPTEGIRTC